MKLLNGKFYENGVPVPLEFGNKEQIKLINEAQIKLINEAQIKLINEAQKVVDDLKGDGLVVDIDIETIQKVSVSAKCLCGSTVHFPEREIYENDSAEDEMKGETAKCRNCQKKYILDEFDGELVVKLQK